MNDGYNEFGMDERKYVFNNKSVGITYVVHGLYFSIQTLCFNVIKRSDIPAAPLI